MFKRKELAQAARKNLKKHYCTWMDRWYWNESRDSSKIWEREYRLKDKGQWILIHIQLLIQCLRKSRNLRLETIKSQIQISAPIDDETKEKLGKMAY